MKTLHFSILINVSKEKVWDVMLSDKTYRQWAATFMPGSHFVGSWNKGSKIQFVAADEAGKLAGMTSVIMENKPHHFISIKHLGLVGNGVEDTTSEEAKKWVGFENYTFNEAAGKTQVDVALDMADDFVEYMSGVWPKALEKVKELAET